MADNMERFTQRARRVMSLAHEEAERLQHAHIGTEHLLLAMMREKESLAYKVLRQLEMEYFQVSDLVKKLTEGSPRSENTSLNLSADLKRTLEYAVGEARQQGHQYVGTEHLLLGMVRQTEGIALEVLKRMSVSKHAIRRQVQKAILGSEPQSQPKVISVSSDETVLKYQRPSINVGSIHNELLFRLLPMLSRTLEEAAKLEIQRFVEQEINNILDHRRIILSEIERSQLLEPLTAPFKPPDSNRRQLRFRITDKVTGEVRADLSMSVTQARGLLPMFAEALKNGQTGKLLVMDDIEDRIEISIDDEQQADAGTA